MSTGQGGEVPAPRRSAGGLDAVDRAILAELRRDGRISVRALADRAHISRANAYARITRMVDEGMIAGFTVDIRPQHVGLGTSAYVSLTIEQNAWRAVSAKLREIPYVEHFALVGGDYDIVVLLRTPDNSTLREVVLERIQDIPGVRSTRTWLVFEEAQGAGPAWDVAPA